MEATLNIPEPLKPISWLAGRWVTENGLGSYPSINEFKYCDTVEFKCIGQPMFNYSSVSRHPEKLTPMHQESGFLRIKPGTNELALVLGHNFGLTSIEEGTIDETKKEIVLESTHIGRISFSKSPSVIKTKREIKLLTPNSLEIINYMQTTNNPMTQHLRAVYIKEN